MHPIRMHNTLSNRISDKRFSLGFSLTELLTVAIIAGLLFGLLAPAIANARRISKHDACLDRLRAIGTGSRMYEADDPNGWYIPAHHQQFLQDPQDPLYIGAYEWGGKSGIGRPAIRGDFLTSRYGTLAGFGPATRPLNRLMYPHEFRDNTRPIFEATGALRDTRLALGEFRCPADDGPPRAAHCPEWVQYPERPSFDHFGTSYAANLFMITGESLTYPYSNSPYLRPGSRVPNPGRTIAYEDNIGRWAWAARREACNGGPVGVDPGPTRAIRGWHGRNWTYNNGFVDGHADTVKIYIEGTEDAFGYAHHYVVETVFDDPETQEHYDCVIIRGPGWQKDTLPAPPLVVGGNSISIPGRQSYENCVESSN